MNIKEIQKNARERMKGFCNVCKVCNGVACAGEVPGMGGSLSGMSFRNNVDDLARIRIAMRTIHDVKTPDTNFNFFEQALKMPIISAPVTGSAFNMGGYLDENRYNEAVIMGSKEAGTIAMTGDSGNPELYDMGLEALKKVHGKGVPIIKPRDNYKIKELIKKAENISPIAVGMDIDGAGLITMALKGAPVSPKMKSELEELVQSTTLPFILKGIMTVEDAVAAAEAGVKGIVVSNHGGRVLDHTDSTCNALPAIAKAVKGKMMILVDGGIRTGVDVFKMLALGADAVLIGRPIIIGAFGGGAEGVQSILQMMNAQLYQTMILTGAATLKDIDGGMII